MQLQCMVLARSNDTLKLNFVCHTHIQCLGNMNLTKKLRTSCFKTRLNEFSFCRLLATGCVLSVSQCERLQHLLVV